MAAFLDHFPSNAGTLNKTLEDFASVALPELVAGALSAALIYLLIEYRLRLRDDRRRREENRLGILKAIYDELHHNSTVADHLLEHLPGGSLPYARFETNGWELLRQVAGLTVLDQNTIQPLLETYARTRSANEQHRLLLDLTYGATGAVVAMVAASSPDNGHASFKRFDDHRKDLRRRLQQRVEDLQTRIPKTMQSVKEELRAAGVDV